MKQNYLLRVVPGTTTPQSLIQQRHDGGRIQASPGGLLHHLALIPLLRHSCTSCHTPHPLTITRTPIEPRPHCITQNSHVSSAYIALTLALCSPNGGGF